MSLQAALNKKVTPIADHMFGAGTADRAKASMTRGLSKVTGKSVEELNTPFSVSSGGKYSTAGGKAVYDTKEAINKAKAKTGAIANKIGGAYKKATDMGSDYITNRVMLQPSIDRAKGEQADKTRQQITRRRESNKNDKALGY